MVARFLMRMVRMVRVVRMVRMVRMVRVVRMTAAIWMHPRVDIWNIAESGGIILLGARHIGNLTGLVSDHGLYTSCSASVIDYRAVLIDYTIAIGKRRFQLFSGENRDFRCPHFPLT